MMVLVAMFQAQAGRGDEVARLLGSMVPHSLAEPGCVMYIVNRAVEDTNAFLLYEQYRDQAALDEHRETEAFQTIVLGKIVPLLERWDRVFYQVVPAGAAD